MIEHTAKRELIEELGDDIEIELTNEILAVRENKIHPWYVPHITIMIKAYYKGGSIKPAEPNKCSVWQWFDLENLPDSMFSGERNIIEHYKRKEVRVVTDWNEPE